MSEYIFNTQRLGFAIWSESDLDLAHSLWGNRDVMRFLSSAGYYDDGQVKSRLRQEIHNYKLSGVQYWKLYTLADSLFMGCCGLKPIDEYENAYELGFQLLPDFWRKGYAEEAAEFCIKYAFEELKKPNLYARHHPENKGSRNLLLKLGFAQFDSALYEPTGLYHPVYKYDYV